MPTDETVSATLQADERFAHTFLRARRSLDIYIMTPTSTISAVFDVLQKPGSVSISALN